MIETNENISPATTETMEPEFEGVYGRYRITNDDKLEVKKYRLALLTCGISFSAGLTQWLILGPSWAFLWLIPMAISLGLALKWIHIYLRPLHKALQIFWGIGCIGAIAIAISKGTPTMLSSLVDEPILTWAIGPIFAALTGIGFKEFFCFRRPEAIGMTFLIPAALLGHLSGLLGGATAFASLSISALLFLILALRKFGTDASADVGDKSVFNYLNNVQTANSLL